MEIRRRNFLVYRILCFLMALHVLNISIDTPDMEAISGRATTYHKNLSINEIGSISEFVLETCLGIADAIPEQDDPDDESEAAEQEQDYAFTQLFRFTPMLPSIHYLTRGNLVFRPAHVPKPVSEIIAPPPPTVDTSALSCNPIFWSPNALLDQFNSISSDLVT